MKVLAIDIDGFEARLATLHGGRVRTFPGGLSRWALTVSQKGSDLLFGPAAQKRAVTHPTDTVDGLAALIAAPPAVVQSIAGWRVTTTAEGVDFAGRYHSVNELCARALDHYVGPAMMLFDAEPDRILITLRSASARRATWQKLLSSTSLAGAEVVERSIAAIQAARVLRRCRSVAVIEVGRVGVSARVAEQEGGDWSIAKEHEVTDEGLHRVDERLVEELRERGKVPGDPRATAMLFQAARQLREELATTEEAFFPMTYAALGGEGTHNLRLDRRALDRSFDAVIRALRKCLVRLDGPSIDAALVHGPAARRTDVLRTIHDVLGVEAQHLRVDVVHGAPLAVRHQVDPQPRDDAPKPRRAAPARVRYSAARTRRRSDPLLRPAPTPTPSEPPAQRSERPPAPTPSKRPSPRPASVRPTRPPGGATVPPAPLLTLPEMGEFTNPQTPADLLAVSLRRLDEPSSVPQLLFACARARLTGRLEIDFDGGEMISAAYEDGQPRWQLRERRSLVESLKYVSGRFRVSSEELGTSRPRSESVHAVVTDAVRKLVWTFEDDAFLEAFGEKRTQRPRSTLDDERLLLRRGFRRQEVRFLKFACKGEEPLEELIRRQGLGPRGMLCVLTLLDLYGFVAWS
ncbi:MAG: hypothetical protein AAGE52_23195 [Myxococcota bacterium]